MMWVVPFLAGAGVSWMLNQSTRARVSTAEQRMIDYLGKVQSELTDELRLTMQQEFATAREGLGPEIAREVSSTVRTKLDEIKAGFLPHMSDLLNRWRDRYGAFDYKKVLSGFPGILEALSMYYVMIDSETPLQVKLKVAAALSYLLMPNDWIPDDMMGGEIDDVAVILYAFNQVKAHVKQKHVQKAKDFLRDEGHPQIGFTEQIAYGADYGRKRGPGRSKPRPPPEPPPPRRPIPHPHDSSPTAFHGADAPRRQDWFGAHAPRRQDWFGAEHGYDDDEYGTSYPKC